MPDPGVCAIKTEFIKKNENAKKTPTEKEYAIENSKEILLGKHKNDSELFDDPDAKKSKSDKPGSNIVKNKQRGQNKSRPKTFQEEKESIACPSIINIKEGEVILQCQFKNCRFIHDPLLFLKNKPADIAKECHVFNLRGSCPRGLTCRFGSNHITEAGKNIINEDKVCTWVDDTFNTLSTQLKNNLQKRKYDFSIAETLIKKTDRRLIDKKPVNGNDDKKDEEVPEKINHSGTVTDEDLVKLLGREKTQIDWRDKLYLSPLTTVGNLPFRRICKGFGVDITCGEMALCESLLKGLKQEWALVKRHASEDLFGVQICGTNVYTIGKVAQLMEEEVKVDFVDLNLGCPIELIYKKGGGCGMLHRLPALEASVLSASRLLSVPFTVKTRTGVYQDKKVAHALVPKFAEWGASLITVHGRSREARYTRMADWEYIESCAKAAAPCPVFGNGDILSYEDYAQKRESAPTVQGVMIGRGALIKPWIFTEIKEQKIWDISSSERFDILKKYTSYGLEHWGSDTRGVENTRRFLLEWLSFLYRYVPVGILERPPQRINERPPIYFGRDDMETLMASGNCADWIKISEMLLGPVPDGFKFLPKHKANSYK